MEKAKDYFPVHSTTTPTQFELLEKNNFHTPVKKFHSRRKYGSPVDYDSPVDDVDNDKDYIPEQITPTKFRSNRKLTWNTPLRKTVRTVFKQFIESGVAPSIHECQKLAYENKLLEERSLPQIRSWIIAEIARNSASTKGKKCIQLFTMYLTRMISVNRWTTPQKHLCRKLFNNYYDKTASRKYPSVLEMKEALESSSDLQGKTVNQLRSHLQHEFSLLAKKSHHL